MSHYIINENTSITGSLDKPRKSLSSSPIGLRLLDKDNDIFYNTNNLIYSGQVLTSETGSLTSFLTHSTSSNSAYAFSVAQLLLKHDIISTIPLTSSSTTLSVYFRGNNTENDIINDSKLNIGKIGIISLKKNRFGDKIRELSFSAVTTNGLMFKDSFSASKWHGIITKTVTSDTLWASALTSGIILYDYGIITILGESLSSINSISSLSSINYNSDTVLNTLNIFCSVGQNELNYSTNDSAFYNSSITSDPDDSSDNSLTAFNTYGFKWGEEIPGAKHSQFYLRDFKNRNPYITTVGLFNENNEMLMVAKLSQPIIKTKNVPITLKISYDF